MRKTLLTVAGFDPSSGAGATLDLRVFRHFGFHGLAILTAITIQNSSRVYGYRTLSPKLALEQYRRLKSDFNLSGIKIGMLGSRKIIPVIAEIAGENRSLPLVVDPVFRSSSGRWLLEKSSLRSYLNAISGKITLITPNLNEASLILGERIDRPEKMEEAARSLSQLTSSACLVKGGHLPGTAVAVDVLFDGSRFYHFQKKKLPLEVHGSGCFLSSAILCFLAAGYSLPEACRRASAAVYHRLRSPLKISRRPLFDI
ncbi:MAG: hydroxymethylpyrimidine/phosphomethylpyrimidine kinase [Candidatus Saccharicenans sp.]|nr:hydroxymethylpyrimidine/phosphomethylpyrimidine kinase [Candidatus Saccharicenans sp.]MDH7492605.1 hydroxymethylpyrimidine/phosphomethylpyrimidine kinase [Candidatus Saccharicenans sp.]